MIHLKFSVEAVQLHKVYCQRIVKPKLEILKAEKLSMSANRSQNIYMQICDYLIQNLDTLSVGVPEQLRDLIKKIKADPVFEKMNYNAAFKEDDFRKELNKTVAECFSYDTYSEGAFGGNITAYAVSQNRLDAKNYTANWSYEACRNYISEILAEYDLACGNPPNTAQLYFEQEICKLQNQKAMQHKKGSRHSLKREEYELLLEKTRKEMERRKGKKIEFWACCGAYWLEKELNLSTCPYCNRNYITMIPAGENKMRADLDHFFPKSVYPYLSVSLYNLVPACKVCNSSQKSRKEFSETTLSPYEFALTDKAAFRYSSASQTITFSGEPGSDPTDAALIDEYGKMFGTEEVYQTHLGLAKAYYEKNTKYRYFDNMIVQDQLARNMYLSKEDQYKLLLGTVPEKEHILDESLSMLRRDLIRQFWGEDILKLIEEK